MKTPRIVRSVYVGVDDWIWLKQYCADHGLTVSAAIETMIAAKRERETRAQLKLAKG